MKAIDILKTNKDLDLRRFGKNVYSKAEQSGGGGSESMDYKTYCDTVIRNYIENYAEYLESQIENFNPSDIVMPDAYMQFTGDGENDYTFDGDYTRPYNSIMAVYNSNLVIDGDKIYIGCFEPITASALDIVRGSRADKLSMPDDYVGIVERRS